MLAAGRRSREQGSSSFSKPEDTIIVGDLSQLLNARARAVIKAKLNAEYLASMPPLRVLREQKPNEVTERCRGRSGRIFSDSVLCCLLPGHEPRRSAILLVEARLFDPLILLVIICNCATMAWESPLDPPGTSKANFIAGSEVFFIGIFTAEMFTKMLAYGLMSHHNSYLRDGWCQLDFLVVSLAWLPIIIPAFGHYSVLRAFRALRPLRALRRVPGMPVLVQWILDVMPKMARCVTACCLLPAACCLRPAACCLLPAACSSPTAPYPPLLPLCRFPSAPYPPPLPPCSLPSAASPLLLTLCSAC